MINNKYQNYDILVARVRDLQDPIMQYLNKYTAKVKSITIDSNYYDKIVVALRDLNRERASIFKSYPLNMTSKIVITCIHGDVDILRREE